MHAHGTGTPYTAHAQKERRRVPATQRTTPPQPCTSLKCHDNSGTDAFRKAFCTLCVCALPQCCRAQPRCAHGGTAAQTVYRRRLLPQGSFRLSLAGTAAHGARAQGAHAKEALGLGWVGDAVKSGHCTALHCTALRCATALHGAALRDWMGSMLCSVAQQQTAAAAPVPGGDGDDRVDRLCTKATVNRCGALMMRVASISACSMRRVTCSTR